MHDLIQKIPKGAVIGILFALCTYLYNKGTIGQAELELVSQISAVLGVAGSTISRLPKK